MSEIFWNLMMTSIIAGFFSLFMGGTLDGTKHEDGILQMVCIKVMIACIFICPASLIGWVWA